MATPDAARLKTATATMTLVERICGAEGNGVVVILAAAEIDTSESAMGECVGKANQLSEQLNATNWEIFDAIGKLNDQRLAASQAILAKVREALTSDEHVVPLAATLKEAQSKAVRLLADTPVPPGRGLQPTPPIPPPPSPGWQTVDSGAKQDLDFDSAMQQLTKLGDGLTDKQRIRVTLNWTIQEKRSTQ